MQSPRLSVRRGRRLTVIVSAAHAWWGILIQFGLEPIKDPVDTLGRLAISLIRMRAIDPTIGKRLAAIRQRTRVLQQWPDLMAAHTSKK